MTGYQSHEQAFSSGFRLQRANEFTATMTKECIASAPQFDLEETTKGTRGLKTKSFSQGSSCHLVTLSYLLSRDSTLLKIVLAVSGLQPHTRTAAGFLNMMARDLAPDVKQISIKHYTTSLQRHSTRRLPTTRRARPE